MTKLVNGKLILESEPEDVCELCGTVAELRPYGPKGERICFPCGMKNIETTKKAFAAILDQTDTVVIGDRKAKPRVTH